MTDCLLPDLPALLEEWCAVTGNPELGISVGLMVGDHVDVHVRGLANVATAQPVHRDTVFQMGSNTKLWTATLAMALVDAGLLDLDAPVTTYEPGFRLSGADAGVVTIRHLLTHTGGFFGDYFGGSAGASSTAAFVDELAGVRQLHPVGHGWSYCNSGWVLLGRIVELVTGTDYATALRTTVLDPLGASHTRVEAADIVPLRAAVGHAVDPETGSSTVLPYGLLPASAPAGSTPVSSAEDMLRFIRLHLDGGRTVDGTQVLSAESAALMRTKQVDLPAGMGRSYGMGLGWFLRRLRDGREVVGHGGTTPSGFVSLLEVVPDERVAVVVLTNSPGGAPVAKQTLEYALEALTGSTLTPDPISWPDPVLDLDWGSYAGEYSDGSMTFQVSPAEGCHGLAVTQTVTARLDGHATPPPQSVTLAAVTPELFAPAGAGAESLVQFVGRTADGRPEHLFAGRLYPRRA